MVVAVLLVIEACSFWLAWTLQGKGLFYTVPSTEGFERYKTHRHVLLGWNPNPRSPQVTDDGSRVLPSFSGEGSGSCVSLYGDSFTWSSGVDPRHSWADVLARLRGCRVKNYGMGAYGSDQAFLRYRLNEDDGSRIVFLNHLTENILRNVNRYRRFLTGRSKFKFKPRFVVEGDTLRLLEPLRPENKRAFLEIVRHPANSIPRDYFVPGGPSGRQWMNFPYAVRVLGALGDFRVQSEIRGTPPHASFYRPGHPSGALRVTTKIAETFRALAVRRGQTPVFSIIPTGLDLLHFRDTGRWVHTPLKRNLEEAGVQVLDFGPPLMERIGREAVCDYFRRCAGHFNERGYRLLGRIADSYLREHPDYFGPPGGEEAVDR